MVQTRSMKKAAGFVDNQNGDTNKRKLDITQALFGTSKKLKIPRIVITHKGKRITPNFTEGSSSSSASSVKSVETQTQPKTSKFRFNDRYMIRSIYSSDYTESEYYKYIQRSYLNGVVEQEVLDLLNKMNVGPIIVADVEAQVGHCVACNKVKTLSKKIVIDGKEMLVGRNCADKIQVIHNFNHQFGEMVNHHRSLMKTEHQKVQTYLDEFQSYIEQLS